MTARAIVRVIEGYRRHVSSRTPACCRLEPSCSDYAVQALHGHGARRGGALAVRRVLRCRPGGPVGADPVPPPPGPAVLAPRGRRPATPEE